MTARNTTLLQQARRWALTSHSATRWLCGCRSAVCGCWCNTLRRQQQAAAAAPPAARTRLRALPPRLLLRRRLSRWRWRSRSSHCTRVRFTACSWAHAVAHTPACSWRACRIPASLMRAAAAACRRGADAAADAASRRCGVGARHWRRMAAGWRGGGHGGVRHQGAAAQAAQGRQVRLLHGRSCQRHCGRKKPERLLLPTC